MKPAVQILGSSKSIRHTKVKILRLKSCFLRKKETELHENFFERHFQKNYSVGVRDGFTLVCFSNDLHLARKPRPRSSSVLLAMPSVNQERLVVKFPNSPHLLSSTIFHSYRV